MAREMVKKIASVLQPDMIELALGTTSNIYFIIPIPAAKTAPVIKSQTTLRRLSDVTTIVGIIKYIKGKAICSKAVPNLPWYPETSSTMVLYIINVASGQNRGYLSHSRRRYANVWAVQIMRITTAKISARALEIISVTVNINKR